MLFGVALAFEKPSAIRGSMSSHWRVLIAFGSRIFTLMHRLKQAVAMLLHTATICVNSAMDCVAHKCALAFANFSTPSAGSGGVLF
jgi:hypothetical protein